VLRVGTLKAEILPVLVTLLPSRELEMGDSEKVGERRWIETEAVLGSILPAGSRRAEQSEEALRR
jgi:hypothetical protein